MVNNCVAQFENMAIPKGAVDVTFRNTSKIKNIFGCILFAQSISERPHVLNTPSSRKVFFMRERKKITRLAEIERNSPAPNYSNLPELERKHGVRIYIYRRLDKFSLREVFVSPNANVNTLRVNILSQGYSDKDMT